MSDRLPSGRLATIAGLLLALLASPPSDAQLMLLGVGPGATGGACADPNWASVVLLIGNDNATNGTTTYADQSGKHTVTAFAGTPTYSNSSPPTGMTTSIAFTF